MANYAPRYSPGEAHTLQASGTIVAGNVLVVSGSGTVAASSAPSKSICGVAAFDAVSGDKVTVLHGGVQALVAGAGGVTAGDVLEAGASGTVVTHTEGTNDDRVVGVALTTATATNVADVLFFR